MTIEQIARHINSISAERNSPFLQIQDLRYKRGLSPATWKPFATRSIKERYAFHYGGRNELQFNFGNEEGWDDSTIFRYGVAFSLQKDKSQHNPIADFKDKVSRFNKFLATDPAYFEGFRMWYYADKEFEDYFEKVRRIDKSMFQKQNFIFIGKYFDKPAAEITEDDIETILSTFDYLIPLYDHVQFDVRPVEARFSRICWNTKGWRIPSGREGKSKFPGSHEAKYGYGHEEWLLDADRLISGYHYGFLEPVRKQQDAFSGNTYDVYLYTIDGTTGLRFLVGRIRRLEVLTGPEADKVFKTYKEKKWHDLMEEQIRSSGANHKGFSQWKGVDLFNIRYLPEDLELYENMIEVPRGHYINSLSRYAFSRYVDQPLIEEDEMVNFEFQENREGTKKKKGGDRRSGYIRREKMVELLHVHKDIQDKLELYLHQYHMPKHVKPEHPAGYGSMRIDLVANINGKLTYYEIKTYPSVRVSVREAFGQLMEYAHWTGDRRAEELVIVSHIAATAGIRSYMRYLRETYKINIYYQSFDLDKNKLSAKS
jgi:hypothetical protein